jgi:hypothetical protein
MGVCLLAVTNEACRWARNRNVIAPWWSEVNAREVLRGRRRQQDGTAGRDRADAEMEANSKMATWMVITEAPTRRIRLMREDGCSHSYSVYSECSSAMAWCMDADVLARVQSVSPGRHAISP